MKKALQFILALVCLFSLFLAGAETADGGCNLLWTVSCLLVSFLSGKIAIHIDPKVVED